MSKKELKRKRWIKMKRKSFIYWCYLLLWVGKWYTKLKQTLLINFHDTPQQKREKNRIIKQAIHYNKYIVKSGGRYRSIVLAGRRF